LPDGDREPADNKRLPNPPLIQLAGERPVLALIECRGRQANGDAYHHSKKRKVGIALWESAQHGGIQGRSGGEIAIDGERRHMLHSAYVQGRSAVLL
jgi:hypothetical protein